MNSTLLASAMILAEGSSDAKLAGMLTLASLLGGGVTWLANYLSTRRRERRKETQEDEQTTIERLEHLLARVDKDRLDLVADNRKLHERIGMLQITITELTVKSERSMAWIHHLEALLETNNVKFRRWADVVVPGQGPPPPPIDAQGGGNPK